MARMEVNGFMEVIQLSRTGHGLTVVGLNDRNRKVHNTILVTFEIIYKRS